MKYFSRFLISCLLLSVFFTSLHSPALAAPIKLSLADCIALALKNNPSLKIAETGKEKSFWAVEQAKTGKGVTLGFSHIDKRDGSLSNDFSNQLELTLPLYSGGKLEGLIDQAKENYKISQFQVAASRQQLTLNVTTQYYIVLQTKKLLAISFQSVTDLTAHLKNVQAKYDAGTVAKSDVLQTAVKLANAQDELIKAQNNYDLAVVSLANLISLPLNSNLVLNEDFTYGPFELTLEESIKYALLHRPEMAEAQSGVAAAEAEIKIAQSGKLPALSIAGSNNWSDTKFPGTKNSNWLASVNLSLNLLDAGMTKTQIKQAEFSKLSSQLQARQTSDNIELEVRQAYLGMIEAEKRIETSKIAVKQAEEDYKIAEVRYSAGVGTNLDVIDAQLSLAQAKTNYVQALYDYNTGKAQIDKAIGLSI